jgi:hypothetical protein
MTPDRFTALSQTYGGHIDRWPVVDRLAAVRMCQDQPHWTAQVLSEAVCLDDLLDAFGLDAPSNDLRQRIFARMQPGPARLALGPRGWGVSLAAASLAGVICGAALMTLAAPDLTKDAVVISALGDQGNYLDLSNSSAKEPQ